MCDFCQIKSAACSSKVVMSSLSKVKMSSFNQTIIGGKHEQWGHHNESKRGIAA